MLLYIADGIDDHRHNKESRCKPRRLVSPSNGIIAKGANKKDGHDGAGNHLKDPAHHGLAGIAQPWMLMRHTFKIPSTHRQYPMRRR